MAFQLPDLNAQPATKKTSGFVLPDIGITKTTPQKPAKTQPSYEKVIDSMMSKTTSTDSIFDRAKNNQRLKNYIDSIPKIDPSYKRKLYDYAGIGGKISEYKPTAGQKAINVAKKTGDYAKVAGYGVGKSLGVDAASRLIESTVLKDAVGAPKNEEERKLKSQQTENKILGSYMGYNPNYDVSQDKGVQTAKGVGELTGTVAQLAIGNKAAAATKLPTLVGLGAVGATSGAVQAYGKGAKGKDIAKEAAITAASNIAGGSLAKSGGVLVQGGKKVAGRALQGAGEMLPISTLTTQGMETKERLKRTAEDVAIGGAFGVGGELAAKGVGKIVSNIKGAGTNKALKQISKTLNKGEIAEGQIGKLQPQKAVAQPTKIVPEVEAQAGKITPKRSIKTAQTLKPKGYTQELKPVETTVNKVSTVRDKTVVDKDIVYHGTNKNFKEFDKSQNKRSTLYGPGFYFTDSLKSAEEYATTYRGNTGSPRVIKAKLTHNKLWDYNNDKITPQQFEKIFNYTGDYPRITEPTKLGQLRGVTDISSGLKEMGYDGFKIVEKDGSKTYAVFNPEQIKQIPDIKSQFTPSTTVQKGYATANKPVYPTLKRSPTQVVEANKITTIEGSIKHLESRRTNVTKRIETLKQSKAPASEIKKLENNLHSIDLQLFAQRERLGKLKTPTTTTATVIDQTVGDSSTFRSKISRDIKKPKTNFTEKVDKIRTQFIDDLAPLERLEKNIRGKVASAESSLYKQSRLFKGSPTKANEIVSTKLSPIIKDIESKGYTYKDLGDYALAVHAKKVNAAKINSGFSNAEIDGVIRELGTPEMEVARKELIKLNNSLLDDLIDAGVLSKESVNTLRDKWSDYMPLFRSFDDDKIEFAKGLKNAMANVSNPIKKLTGSSRDVIDPIESMVKNIFKLTTDADRNRVALQISKLADEDISQTFIRKLSEKETVGRKNVVNVWENGERISYEVEQETYKAILNLDKESSSMLINLLQKPAAVLRAGATLTPEFSLRNPIRDVLQAYTVSKSGFNPIVDFPLALIDTISKGKHGSKLYNEFMSSKAGYGNVVSMDRNMHREALEKVIKEPVSKKFVNIVTGKSLIKLLRAISDTTETATKLGEFKAAIRKGATKEEAAYRARDIMDFARAGYSVRSANKIVAFLNANIQGKSKLIRAIKENPIGVTTRAIKAVTLPTIGVYVMQQKFANDTQKATIKDAPDWMKDTFWLVPIPGTDIVARLPKPFDLAIPFSNLPEKLMQYTFDKDPEAFDGFIKRSMGQLSVPMMITGVLPIIEGMANYSFFRESPIIPRREEKIGFEEQYDINTSETAKIIAKGVNKLTGGEGQFKNFGSPRIIDNTIRGVTAGLGTYATTAIDSILYGLGAAEKPIRPQKDITQQPFIKAFTVSQTGTGKAIDELYKLQDKLERELGSAKLKGSPFKDKGKLNKIKDATEKIGKISKRIRGIQNDKVMTAQEKRVELDRLNKKRNNIAIEAMERMN